MFVKHLVFTVLHMFIMPLHASYLLEIGGSVYGEAIKTKAITLTLENKETIDIAGTTITFSCAYDDNLPRMLHIKAIVHTNGLVVSREVISAFDQESTLIQIKKLEYLELTITPKKQKDSNEEIINSFTQLDVSTISGSDCTAH